MKRSDENSNQKSPRKESPFKEQKLEKQKSGSPRSPRNIELLQNVELSHAFKNQRLAKIEELQAIEEEIKRVTREKAEAERIAREIEGRER